MVLIVQERMRISPDILFTDDRIVTVATLCESFQNNHGRGLKFLGYSKVKLDLENAENLNEEAKGGCTQRIAIDQ